MTGHQGLLEPPVFEDDGVLPPLIHRRADDFS